MNDAITYRRATSADLPILCELGRSLNGIHHRARPDIYRDTSAQPHLDGAHWRVSLQGGDHAAFVAEQDGIALGFITVQLASPTGPLMQPIRFGQIRSVGVADGHRGQGIGRALIALAESWAVARGAAEVRLTVWTFNAPARRLYEELGYHAFAFEMSKGAAQIAAPAPTSAPAPAGRSS